MALAKTLGNDVALARPQVYLHSRGLAMGAFTGRE
jgi:hypothetical protein